MKNNYTKIISNVYVYFLLALAAIVTFGTIDYELFNGYFYFTNQSNLLVLITLILYVVGLKDKKEFKILAFITLISIVMTSIIFHLLLGAPTLTSYLPFLFRTGIQNLLTHTIIPIMFLWFYLFINKKTVVYKRIYLGLIHPIIYFAYFLITGPYTNFYPYPFMDVGANGIMSVVITALIILPVVVLLELLFIYLKNKINEKEFNLI